MQDFKIQDLKQALEEYDRKKPQASSASAAKNDSPEIQQLRKIFVEIREQKLLLNALLPTQACSNILAIKLDPKQNGQPGYQVVERIQQQIKQIQKLREASLHKKLVESKDVFTTSLSAFLPSKDLHAALRVNKSWRPVFFAALQETIKGYALKKKLTIKKKSESVVFLSDGNYVLYRENRLAYYDRLGKINAEREISKQHISIARFLEFPLGSKELIMTRCHLRDVYKLSKSASSEQPLTLLQHVVKSVKERGGWNPDGDGLLTRNGVLYLCRPKDIKHSPEEKELPNIFHDIKIDAKKVLPCRTDYAILNGWHTPGSNKYRVVIVQDPFKSTRRLLHAEISNPNINESGEKAAEANGVAASSVAARAQQFDIHEGVDIENDKLLSVANLSKCGEVRYFINVLDLKTGRLIQKEIKDFYKEGCLQGIRNIATLPGGGYFVVAACFSLELRKQENQIYIIDTNGRIRKQFNYGKNRILGFQVTPSGEIHVAVEAEHGTQVMIYSRCNDKKLEAPVASSSKIPSCVIQ